MKVVNGEPELSASDAVNFASAWTSERAPITRGWLERTHGAPIEFKTLKSCGRPLYARSAFAPPPQNIPAPYRRVHGAWWLITFCDEAGSPSVSVAVSAWATDLTMHAGGLRFPQISGTEFVAVGIPLGHIGEYPMSPEMAIELTAQQAGKRIQSVPELITPLPSDGPPQLARWHLSLEGAANIHTRSGARSTSDIFIGPPAVGAGEISISVAAQEQPTSIDLGWTPVPFAGEAVKSYAARAIRQNTKILMRAGTAVRVEPISAWGN